MKKTLVLIAIAGMMVFFGTDIMAQNGKGKGKANAPKTNWVDANGDGICDNVGTGTPKQTNAVKANFVDADGDGVCDNTGTNAGRGKRTNFVDADGDGVCDNVGTCTGTCTGTGTPKLDGTGSKMRKGKK